MTVNLYQTVMTTLLDCAAQGLTDHDAPVESVFIAPGGPPAWDNCCEDGGQLYVRLVQSFPTSGPGSAPFPGQDTRPRCHPVLMAARLGVGVLRCSQAFATEEGAPPSDATKTTEGTRTSMDASILLEAILCCLTTALPNLPWVVDVWNPLGPNGGCVGGEWQLIVGVDTCRCG
jgi:hypothetical protein